MTIGKYIQQNYNPEMKFEGARKHSAILDLELDRCADILEPVRGAMFSSSKTGDVTCIYQEVKYKGEVRKMLLAGRDLAFMRNLEEE